MHRNSFFDAIENNLVQVLFRHLSDQVSPLCFIEVGAYDGKTASQTHEVAVERDWKGLVIEPAPAAFAALTETYRGNAGITPVNYAVSDTDGRLPFYVVRNLNPNSWEGMLSSLNRETILRQHKLIPEIASLIEEHTISVRPLSAIAREYGLDKVDLVKIDAEGNDDAVARSIDFTVLRPQLILLEHKLIPTDRMRALDIVMKKAGYQALPMWANTFYVTGPFAEDESVRRVLAAAPALFPEGRDPEWGNGNWAGPRSRFPGFLQGARAAERGGKTSFRERAAMRIKDRLVGALNLEGFSRRVAAAEARILAVEMQRQTASRAHSRHLGNRILELLRLLAPRDPLSGEFVRVGRAADGGYVLFAPLLDGNVAYSIGVAQDVSWDVDMAARGYQIYQYDHTIRDLPVNHPAFRFKRIGLAVATAENMRTLPEMLAENGHTGARGMVLKLDIDGSEWDVLSELPETALDGFDQIAIELHWLDGASDDRLFARTLNVLKKLRAAFTPVHVHGNNFSDLVVVGGTSVPAVLEMTYVRTSRVPTGPCRRTFPTALDRPNWGDRADLVLGSFQFPDADI